MWSDAVISHTENITATANARVNISGQLIQSPLTEIDDSTSCGNQPNALYLIKAYYKVSLQTIWLSFLIPSWKIVNLSHFRRTITPVPKGATSLILLANVNSCSCSLYVVVRPSVVCLSSVTFVHPTQAIEILRQCFYTIWYLGHLWPFGKNFTEIVPGELLRRSTCTMSS